MLYIVHIYYFKFVDIYCFSILVSILPIFTYLIHQNYFIKHAITILLISSRFRGIERRIGLCEVEFERHETCGFEGVRVDEDAKWKLQEPC